MEAHLGNPQHLRCCLPHCRSGPVIAITATSLCSWSLSWSPRRHPHAGCILVVLMLRSSSCRILVTSCTFVCQLLIPVFIIPILILDTVSSVPVLGVVAQCLSSYVYVGQTRGMVLAGILSFALKIGYTILSSLRVPWKRSSLVSQLKSAPSVVGRKGFISITLGRRWIGDSGSSSSS
jgi:hypothetical protein